MELIKVSGFGRSESGKSGASRLRSSGKIPAVLYGRKAEPLSLAVTPKDIVSVLGSEHGRNAVIQLDVDGKDQGLVMLGEYQYHPVTRALLHADLIRISAEEPVDVEVPFEVTGKPKGVVMGGILRVVFRKLPVRCLPGQVPVKIVYDVTELDLDEHVAVSQLSLPEGVSIRLPAAQTVAGIVGDDKKGEEEAAPAGAAAAAAAAPAAAKK